MKTIYKLTLEIEKEQTIMLPKGAVITADGEQGNVPRLWYMHDPQETEFEERVIRIVWSGDPIGEDEDLTLLGMVQAMTGGNTWHIFEKTVEHG